MGQVEAADRGHVKALRRLQRLPPIVRGFFADPNLAYITNTA